VAEFDLNALLQQAQQFQQKVREMQDAAANQLVTTEAGGGMVKVTVDGSMAVHKIDIDPSLLASNDREMLQDLIVVAVNQALKRAQQLVAEEMGKLGPFGGIKLPGT